jgi:NitT/TauT family transport system substrate-binding protein
MLAVLALLCCFCPAQAGDKITLISGGSEKIIYLPAQLADRLGYFKEQGLDVELLSEPAGVNAEDALLTGVVQGVVGFYDHTIDLQAKGKAVLSVVQLTQAPGEVMLVSSRTAETLKSPKDFAGKNLGVTGLGSSTHLLIQYLAIVNGIKPSKLTAVPVGAGDTFIAAMRKGRIDAGMTTEPTVSRLLHTGEAKVLVDMRSPEDTIGALGGIYPASCLYMRAFWVNNHKQQVQKLANAFVKALKYIQSHSAEDIASHMPTDYYAGDKDLYIKALTNSKATFTPDGRMPASGPHTVLKVFSAVNLSGKSRQIDLSETYTTEFVSAVK